jgi:pyruvate/2-oxoglutarate dehydrogenase complex dihydrolipoamide dehydrogenase (E3) component
MANINSGDKILVACGTRPAHNPNIHCDGTKVFDSDLILTSGAWQNAR